MFLKFFFIDCLLVKEEVLVNMLKDNLRLILLMGER